MSDEQRDAAAQWLAKAKGDWKTVTLLSGHEDCPRDSVCFHCQQYVEKLLKALLTLHAIEAPRTHDLKRLAQLVVAIAPELAELMDDADLLTDHAVQTRYPDEWRIIESAEMSKMKGLAERFAAILLPKIETRP